APAALGKEQSSPLLAAAPPSAGERRPSPLEVAAHGRHRRLARRHDARLSPLALDANLLFVMVHIRYVQRHQLLRAQAARVRELEHRAVALLQSAARGNTVQQARRLAPAQRAKSRRSEPYARAVLAARSRLRRSSASAWSAALQAALGGSGASAAVRRRSSAMLRPNFAAHSRAPAADARSAGDRALTRAADELRVLL